MSGCDEATLELFRMGLLAEPEAEAVRRHVHGCADCRERLHALDLEDLRLEAALSLSPEEREALDAFDLPGRLAVQLGQRRRTGWIMGAGLLAAAAGAVVGLQLLVLPWLDGLPVGGLLTGQSLGTGLAHRGLRTVRRLLWPAGTDDGSFLLLLALVGLAILLLNLRHRRPRRILYHHGR